MAISPIMVRQGGLIVSAEFHGGLLVVSMLVDWTWITYNLGFWIDNN